MIASLLLMLMMSTDAGPRQEEDGCSHAPVQPAAGPACSPTPAASEPEPDAARAGIPAGE